MFSIFEDDPPAQAGPVIDRLAKTGRVIRWDDSISSDELVARIDKLVPPDVQAARGRSTQGTPYVRKGGRDYYLLFNEGASGLECRRRFATGQPYLGGSFSRGEPMASDSPICLAGHTMQVLAVM